MSKIVAQKVFSTPIEVVHSYITTPVNWSNWFEGTLEIEGGVHPVEKGDVWKERLIASGVEMSVNWLCTGSRSPYLCEFEGELFISGLLSGLSKDATLKVRYELSQHENNTVLTRTLESQFPNPVLRLISFLKKRKTANEIQIALEKLRLLLEKM